MQSKKSNSKGDNPSPNRTDNPIVRRSIDARQNARNLLSHLHETDQPGALVKQLAPHDLLLAWNEADDEQRADLLRLADREQAAILIDICCWTTDRPDIAEVETLIEPLVMSGIGGAIHVLDTLEPEIRTLLLKSNVKVHLLEDLNEQVLVPETSELLPCPDGRYYIEFPDPDRVTDVERALWSALLFRPFEEYQPELACVIHDFPSELQETSLRWRTGRLADYGFMPYEKAIAVLVPRSVSEVRKLATDGAPVHGVPSDIRLPALYEENLVGHQFLDRVMELLSSTEKPEYQERAVLLSAELAAMTNFYLTATRVDLRDVDAVARGSRWVRDTLALGLYQVAKGDVAEAARLLYGLVPAVFLQVGLGSIYPLRDRARALLQNRRFTTAGQGGSVFDPPYIIGLTSLAADVPSRWPALNGEAGRAISLFEPTPDELAPFASPEEIDDAARLLEEAEMMGGLLERGLTYRDAPVRETPASILVLTALANAATNGPLQAKPVLVAAAREFAAKALALREDEFVADALAVFGFDPGSSNHLEGETDPARRLLIRLLQIGWTRLKADAAERVLLVEDV